jgi:hypothetical protein
MVAGRSSTGSFAVGRLHNRRCRCQQWAIRYSSPRTALRSADKKSLRHRFGGPSNHHMCLGRGLRKVLGGGSRHTCKTARKIRRSGEDDARTDHHVRVGLLTIADIAPHRRGAFIWAENCTAGDWGSSCPYSGYERIGSNRLFRSGETAGQSSKPVEVGDLSSWEGKGNNEINGPLPQHGGGP